MITCGLDKYWCAVAFVVSQLFSCSVYRFFIVEFTTLSYILPLLETKSSNKTTVEPLLSTCIVWHGNCYAQYTSKEKIHICNKRERRLKNFDMQQQLPTVFFMDWSLFIEGGTPTWRLHTGLSKLVRNISTNIWFSGKRSNLKFGEVSSSSISYNITISWPDPLNGFRIIFLLRLDCVTVQAKNRQCVTHSIWTCNRWSR